MNVKNLSFDFVMTELFPKLFIDRSNFKVLAKNLDKNLDSSFGRFKSEVADDIILEGCFISPKCYSIKTQARNDHQYQSHLLAHLKIS